MTCMLQDLDDHALPLSSITAWRRAAFSLLYLHTDTDSSVLALHLGTVVRKILMEAFFNAKLCISGLIV